ncbi:hypothetical protein BJ165DRAFT_1963 [Panaeolus papilionaceus]|nr:hypothetical protein BJ165DRAFT_1963 [Panaeolus papilionaceus]
MQDWAQAAFLHERVLFLFILFLGFFCGREVWAQYCRCVGFLIEVKLSQLLAWRFSLIYGLAGSLFALSLHNKPACNSFFTHTHHNYTFILQMISYSTSQQLLIPSLRIIIYYQLFRTLIILHHFVFLCTCILARSFKQFSLIFPTLTEGFCDMEISSLSFEEGHLSKFLVGVRGTLLRSSQVRAY